MSVESLTGEPTPVPVTVGSRVRAGALNRGAVLEIRAERDAVECYAQRARTLTRKMMARKGSIGTLSDRLSGYFLGLTLAVAALAFYLGLATSIEEAVTRAVAALLVTCPCVFGYAAPLAFARGASQAAGKGVVFKSERALELLAKARTFLFDKTGTLTLGDPRVVAADVDDAALAAAGVPRETLLAVLSQLGDLSHHHIPQALAGWAEQQAGGPRFASLDEVTESTGEGLSFSAAGRRWRVGKPGFAGQASAASRTNVTVEGSVVASYAVDDVVRGEARAVLTALKRAGMSLKIVSGDASSRVHQAAKQLGLLTREAVGGRSAAGKALLVETLERAASERSAVGEGTKPLVPIVMVGNGTNDSLAMATADVGIAVASAGPAAQEAAEIVLTKPGVAPLLDALAQSRGAVGAMRRAFAFAALYNVGAMTLAAHGDVSPVVAALLMPFNSLVVTALVTRWSAPELSPIGEDDA